MYTLSFAHSGSVKKFYKEGNQEFGSSHDSMQEGAQITPEAQKKIQEFVQQVVETFEKNPEKKKEFLASLDGVKQSVFKDPVMFQTFLARAYEKHEVTLNTLQGGERTKKIQEFSVFMTDVMLQFAEMNNILQLQGAIKAQQKALEIKYGEIKILTQSGLSDLKKSFTEAT